MRKKKRKKEWNELGGKKRFRCRSEVVKNEKQKVKKEEKNVSKTKREKKTHRKEKEGKNKRKKEIREKRQESAGKYERREKQ